MAELNDAHREEILASLQRGQKIDAIRIYRDATGQGLAESKEFVDQLETALRNSQPGRLPEKSGCGTAVLLTITGIAAIAAMGWRSLLQVDQ